MENEEIQTLVFEALGGCHWEYDLVDDRLVYSDEFFALLGYQPNERQIDSDWVADNIHPKDLPLWQESFLRSLKGESKYFDCELRFKHRDDFYVWIQTRGVVTKRDSRGRAARIVGLVFDISERKAAKESESRYRLFLDNVPDAISLKGSDGRYFYINRQFEKWIGKPSYQIYGQTAAEIFHPQTDTMPLLRDHERRVWEQGETISEERQFPMTSDGRVRHAIITKFPVYDEAGRMLAIGTTNTDVTERVNAREALRRSEQRYRQLFEAAPVILAETDWTRARHLVDALRRQGVDDLRQHLRDHPELLQRRSEIMELLRINREALRVYRADNERALREHLDRDLGAPQRDALIEDLCIFAAGDRRSSVRTTSYRADGEQFPIIRESEMHAAEAEDWSLVLITMRDDSAEQAVRLSEKRYRSLFRVAPVVLVESDWSKARVLVDALRAQGVSDLRRYLQQHPELIHRRDQVIAVTNANEQALEVFGVDSVDEFITLLSGELNDEQRRSVIEDLVSFAAGDRHTRVHSTTSRSNGEMFPIIRECERYADDPEDWSQVLITVRDVSIEETLRQNEIRYRQLFELAPAVLAETDWTPGKKLVDDLHARGVEDLRQFLIDHPELTRYRGQLMKVISVNREALRVYRAPDEESMIRHTEGEMNEVQRLGMIEDLVNFASGQRRSNIACRSFRVDGEEFPMLAESEFYGADPDDWSKVMLTVRDTSAEEAVRLSEMRYRRLFESAPVALFESDWSRGKALIDELRDRGVTEIGNYFDKHPESLQRRDEVLQIIDLNREALQTYHATDKADLIRNIEGPINEEQREMLKQTLLTFSAGRRRASMRGVSVRLGGQAFPILRNTELISSDREDWSRVLSSVHDLTEEVENANRLREYQQELRSLAGMISAAEESERRRISSELHDGTIQNLVLARIHLASLRNSLPTDSAIELADSIGQLLARSLEETRSLIFEISPPVLYELGLEPAVEWLAEHYKQRTGVRVRITSDEHDTRLPLNMNIVLFQAARELLVNIAKHAQAKHVSIDWRHHKDHVVLSIQDDGIGFDVESSEVKKATEGGFGLFAVRERLKLMGADFHLESSASGTRVTISAPLEREQKIA